MFQWIRNPKGKWIKVSVLQEPNTELEISLRPMEYLEEEQQSQQPLERNLNAHKSMRDYRNPPWMSMPSCMVPRTTAPYGKSYKPSWRNHLNFSWGPDLCIMHLQHLHSMLIHLSLNHHSQSLQLSKPFWILPSWWVTLWKSRRHSMPN